MRTSVRIEREDAGRGREAAAAIIDDLARERLDRRGALIAGITAGLSLVSLHALAANAPAGAPSSTHRPMRFRRRSTTPLSRGSAGCVLAYRLSADRDLGVLLLEAGGPATFRRSRCPRTGPVFPAAPSTGATPRRHSRASTVGSCRIREARCSADRARSMHSPTSAAIPPATIAGPPRAAPGGASPT